MILRGTVSFILVVIIGCASSSGAGPESADLLAGAPSVIVRSSEAEVLIPLEVRDSWAWDSEDTRASSLEYEFSLAVPMPNSDGHYAIGYLNFRMGHESPKTGTLAEMLDAGQVQLSRLEGGMGRVIDGPQVKADVTPTGAVRLRLIGSEWIQKVFGERPQRGIILINSPGQERQEHVVRITYRSR